MNQNETFLHVQEAAQFLGVSPNTVRNWGRDAKVPEYRHAINNYRLYKKSDLFKLLQRLRKPRRRSGEVRKPR